MINIPKWFNIKNYRTIVDGTTTSYVENRDRSAAINMTLCAHDALINSTRPRHLCRRKTYENEDTLEILSGVSHNDYGSNFGIARYNPTTCIKLDKFLIYNSDSCVNIWDARYKQ